MLGCDFRFLFLLKIARSYLQMPETQIAGDKASDFLRRGRKKKKGLIMQMSSGAAHSY